MHEKSGSTQKYKCHICDNIYKHYDSLEDHVAIAHDQSETYQCNICNNTFNHVKRFQNHMRVVHEQKYDKKTKKFPCPECERTFQHKDYVEKHLKAIHKKEFEHKRDICLITFSLPYQLKEHTSFKHIGEVKFRCETCDKGFQNEQLLSKNSH